jgi:hypothetical protein
MIRMCPRRVWRFDAPAPDPSTAAVAPAAGTGSEGWANSHATV